MSDSSPDQVHWLLECCGKRKELATAEAKKYVARLQPLQRASSQAAKAKLTELERRGVLKRGTGKLPRHFFKLAPLKFKKSLVEAVLEERSESRW